MAAKLTAVQEFQPRLGSPNNSKLGPAIHTWSIPAGSTCPGATPACLSCCYANRGYFIMPNVAERLLNNWLFSMTPEFVAWGIAAVRAQGVRTLRIHVAGDFYSGEYVDKWQRIIAATPRVRYFAYTRSWRLPEPLRALRALAKRPNLALWFSADVDTGRPPTVPKLRGVAWMARNPEEEAATPQWANLAFRESPKSLLKKVNGVQVCPPEQGLPPQYNKLTCTQCQICFRPQKGTTDVAARPLPPALVALRSTLPARQ